MRRGDFEAPSKRRKVVAAPFTRRVQWVFASIALWALIYPYPYRLCIAVLIVLPLIALAVPPLTRNRIWLRVPEGSRRRNVEAMVFGPPVALGLRALEDFNILDWRPALVAASCVAALLTACYLLVNPETGWASWKRRLAMGGFYFLVCGMSYGWGAIVEANGLLDTSAPMRSPLLIRGKEGPHGSRFPRWHLTLAPAGNGQGEQYDVTRELFDSVAIGQTVCLYAHAGALGFAWREVDFCHRNGGA